MTTAHGANFFLELYYKDLHKEYKKIQFLLYEAVINKTERHIMYKIDNMKLINFLKHKGFNVIEIGNEYKISF